MSQNNNTANGMVRICRHPGDYEGGPFPADQISNVHWGCVSGGVHRQQNGFSLYGYAPYEDVMDIVACSGRHNFGYNDMKICITAAHNKDKDFSHTGKIIGSFSDCHVTAFLQVISVCTIGLIQNADAVLEMCDHG